MTTGPTRKAWTNKKRAAQGRLVFGKNGLVAEDDSLALDQRLGNVNDFMSIETCNFSTYFNSRILPLVREHVSKPRRTGLVPPTWKNNDCEAINHVLKVIRFRTTKFGRSCVQN